MLEVISKDGTMGIFRQIKRENLLNRLVIVKLKPNLPLTILVKDTNGKPLEGVDAGLTTQYSRIGSFGKSVKTNANGEAVIQRVYEGGLYRTQARLDGYYYQNNIIKLLPKAGGDKWQDRVEIVMEPANRVQKGKVVGEDGKPVEGAEVRTDDYSHKPVTTDANGEFVIEGLPDSRMGLRAQKGNSHGWATANKDTEYITINLRTIQVQ